MGYSPKLSLFRLNQLSSAILRSIASRVQRAMSAWMKVANCLGDITMGSIASTASFSRRSGARSTRGQGLSQVRQRALAGRTVADAAGVFLSRVALFAAQ